MRTYCLAFRKHTNNIALRKVTMANKVVRGISSCNNKSKFMKQNHHDKKGVIKYCKTNMLTYCLVCKKNTENKDAKMAKTKNGRLMSSSKCTVCGNKK